MKSVFKYSLLALSLGFAGASFAQAASDLVTARIEHRINNPDNALPGAPPSGGIGQITPLITWHGGPVMPSAPNVHLIWYGNWAQNNGSDNAAGQQIVRDFVNGLNGSHYLAISKGYTGSGGTQVSGNVGVVAEANVGYLRKRLRKVVALSDTDIKTVVTNYINAHGGADANALYFVLTSTDVNETSGFCTQYCGWHTNGSINSTDVKYSFVGNANRCLSGCAIQSTSPNSNAGVDGMVSVIAHELEESFSDPDPRSGWANSAGAENGDMCAWTFGQPANLFQAANGSYYNVTLPAQGGGSRNFLVQRNLAALDSKCYIDGVTGAQ
jgi:hypothetical protein